LRLTVDKQLGFRTNVCLPLPRQAGEGKAGAARKEAWSLEEKAANRWSGKKIIPFKITKDSSLINQETC
jgi:hypothetical protein